MVIFIPGMIKKKISVSSTLASTAGASTAMLFTREIPDRNEDFVFLYM